MIVILIPTFILVYKYSTRRSLICVFIVVFLIGGIIPVFYVSLENEVNPYPGFMSLAAVYLVHKVYFRLPAFVLGIAFAIVMFEYKFVEKLPDGSQPYLKKFLD